LLTYLTLKIQLTLTGKTWSALNVIELFCDVRVIDMITRTSQNNFDCDCCVRWTSSYRADGACGNWYARIDRCPNPQCRWTRRGQAGHHSDHRLSTTWYGQIYFMTFIHYSELQQIVFLPLVDG